jgi:glutamine synthetase
MTRVQAEVMNDQAANTDDREVNKDAKEAADKFDYVRFTFNDIHGVARSKTVARRNFDEFFDSGITVFAGRSPHSQSY